MNPRHAGRKWVAVVRVSKVGDREGDSFMSPDQQEARIRSAVETAGGTVEKVVRELDVSGRSTDRDLLNEALEWVYDRAHERALAVLDVSRLGRTLKGTMEIIETLQHLGAGFMSVQEQMDTTTSSGRLAIQNMAAIAEFQSNTISDRWKSVHEDRISNGLPSGGAARFGYEIKKTTDADGKIKNARVHTPHPENGPVLAQMYRDFIGGKGAMSLARDLNARGIPSPRGVKWNIQGILRTLDCGFGAGYVLVGHYRNDVVRDSETNKPVMDNGKLKTRRVRERVEHVKGKHEGVITEEEWQQFLSTRDDRKKKAPRHKHPKWHLAGLAKCGLCGASLSVSSYRDERTLVICTAYKTSRTCTGVWMSKAKLDRAVFWWLGTRLDDVARHAGASKNRDRERGKAEAARDKAHKLLKKLDKEKIGTARLYAQEDLTDAEYREAKRQHGAEVKKAEAAFNEAEERIGRLAPTEDVYETLIEWGEKHEDPAEYNTLLAKVIDRVEVTKEQVEIFSLVGESHTVPRL